MNKNKSSCNVGRTLIVVSIALAKMNGEASVCQTATVNVSLTQAGGLN